MHAAHIPKSLHVPWICVVAFAATALALLTTAQEGIALAYAGLTVPWTGLLKARLVDWYACALFVPVLAWLARRYPIRPGLWQRHLPILLLAGVPIAVAKEALFVAIGNQFRPGVFDLAVILSEDLSYEVMTAWALLAIAHTIVPMRREAPPRRVSDSLFVRTRSGIEEVRVSDIEYVDAQGNYARLVTPQGRYLLRETMTRLEGRLGREFVRVHRSVIVRRDRIVRVEPATGGGYWIRLASGARLRSGRSYRQAVLEIKGT